MKRTVILLLFLLALVPAGCAGEMAAPNPLADGAVVEEERMPETVDQRTYAARSDPDRGDHARAQMERVDGAIRDGGETVLRQAEQSRMAYTRPVLQEPVARDGFTGRVIP